ncbi:1,2-epoxyphenylacetyl-CoA isomerase [Marinovum algicola]|uniref:Enoyl-CoA hydratase n=1 Tax=Marinovum algicola TaxID=42444 RepID=A0A975WBV8_9RHOB|nr:enoyl-CoA hydratase-related protein [Marinovum algicola]SEJ83037.1 enoyl-CoA hydratase [Marinovum algicola]SLN62588.1 1,2-epoxyphenylacetyl-CoA isomerase [Marinovum algicola]
MSDVLLETSDQIATLTLNRPAKRNALTDEMVDEFLDALESVARSDARVVIVTGAGKGFCAGFDLSLAGVEAEGDETAFWMGRQEKFATLVTRLRAIPQPTVAAVNGAAAGAGLGLALACDTRIGCETAGFSSAFIRVGMSSCDIGVSYLLPRAIGTTRAFEMMLTGRMVDAAEAERIGLTLRSVASDALMPEAETLARAIAENGQMGTWMTKRGMWANLEAGSLQAAIELENRTQILMRSTGSLAERARARGFAKPD